MKRVSIYALALLSIFVLALAQGCNSKPAVNVVGKWAEVDGQDTVEFTAGGTYTGSFIFDSDAFRKTIDGTYTVSGDKVTLKAKADPKDSMVWKVSDAGGVLAVVYQDGGAPKLDGSKTKFRKAN